jgi:malate dehydrogenase (oxaloacetate-decarboxylating)(NADP+)
LQVFLTAAETLAKLVRPEDVANGTLYPPLKGIREVSAQIAAAVAEELFELGVATIKKPQQPLYDYVVSQMWDCTYPSYCPQEEIDHFRRMSRNNKAAL